MKPFLSRWAAALALACFTLSGEAAIIRSPGSTVGQDSFNETVRLVDSSSIFGGGIFTGGTTYDSYQRNSLQPAAHATPPQDCWFNTFQNDPDPRVFRTDCDYQFHVGEQLEFSGAVISALAGTRKRVTWTILGGDKSWSFSEESLGFLFPVLTMPSDLLAGHYSLQMEFEQWAPEGQSFFKYSAYTDQQICVSVYNPPVQICGQSGSERQYLSHYASADLFILPAEVPTPPALVLFALGVGVLGWHRRRRLLA